MRTAWASTSTTAHSARERSNAGPSIRRSRSSSVKIPDPLRLTARSEREAKERYVRFLQRALRCVAPHASLRIGSAPGSTESNVYSLHWTPEPIRAEAPDGKPIFLTIDQLVALGDDSLFPGDVKFKTLKYFYGVSTDPSADPFLYWHWNPSDQGWPYPHVHSEVRDPLNRSMRLHIPTGGRISVEQVLRFLILEGIVRACDPDWESRLDDGHKRFMTAQR